LEFEGNIESIANVLSNAINTDKLDNLTSGLERLNFTGIEVAQAFAAIKPPNIELPPHTYHVGPTREDVHNMIAQFEQVTADHLNNILANFANELNDLKATINSDMERSTEYKTNLARSAFETLSQMKTDHSSMLSNIYDNAADIRMQMASMPAQAPAPEPEPTPEPTPTPQPKPRNWSLKISRDSNKFIDKVHATQPDIETPNFMFDIFHDDNNLISEIEVSTV
jgi:hypothetical protein